jgi:hypothetical protein
MASLGTEIAACKTVAESVWRNLILTYSLDSASKMKSTTQVKISRNILLVLFVVTTVSRSRLKCFVLSNKADNAAAHRQCARDAGALKSDDGNLSNPWSQNC